MKRIVLGLLASVGIAAAVLAASAGADPQSPPGPARSSPASDASLPRPHPERTIRLHLRLPFSRHAERELKPPSPSDLPAAAPDQPGWFQAPGRAGWGVSEQGAETMAGVYSRRTQPEAIEPQMHGRDDHKAVGVSMSLKLGSPPPN